MYLHVALCISMWHYISPCGITYLHVALCISMWHYISPCGITYLDVALCISMWSFYFSYFSIVRYHPDPDKLQLLSGGEDYNIRIWCLQTSRCIATLEGHYSVITGIHFSQDTRTLYRYVRGWEKGVLFCHKLFKIAKIKILCLFIYSICSKFIIFASAL